MKLRFIPRFANAILFPRTMVSGHMCTLGDGLSFGRYYGGL